MGSPAIFAGQRTKLLSSKGLLLKDGTTIDNDGVVNFIRNNSGANGTIGWTEGSYTAASRPSGTFTASSGAGAFAISTTTTTPLGYGTTSFLLTKSAGASRQGRAIETSFALPLSYRAKVLQLNIDYIINSGTFVAGSNSTDSSLIWYCAFSTDNGSTYTVAEPSSFKLLSNSTTISDKFSASIQTPSNATNMKLIAYVAETANSAWVVETIVAVSPSNYVYGTPITDWVSYTPTITGLGSGSATFSRAIWRRVGDSVQVNIWLSKDGSAGTGSSAVEITLPPGLSVDLTKANSTNFGAFAAYSNNSTVAQNNVTSYVTTTSKIAFTNGSATALGSDFQAGTVWTATVTVPIQGWSSSVQMSDGYDGRQVTFRKNDVNTSTTYATGTSSDITWLNANSVSSDDVAGWNGTFYTIRTAGYYKLSTQFVLNGFTYTPGLQYDIFWADSSNNTIYDNAQFTMGSGTSVRVFGGVTTPPIWFNAGQTLKPRYFNGTGVTNSFQSLIIGIEKLAGNPVISASETVGALYTGAPPTGTLGTAWNTITYGTKVKDSHGAYSSGTYTIPVSGQYDISSQVAIQMDIVAGAIAGCGLSINNSALPIYQNQVRGQATTAAGILMPQINLKSVPLKAGDTIKVVSYAGGASPSYLSDAAINFFSITRSGGY